MPDDIDVIFVIYDIYDMYGALTYTICMYVNFKICTKCVCHAPYTLSVFDTKAWTTPFGILRA